MPLYIPINARTEENGDHSRNAAGVEVLTLAPDNIVPAFTELELFWDFEGLPAANREPFRPIPWKRDPFELEDVLVRLDASGPRPVVFNPVVDPAGMWTSLLPPMPIEHYRRLLAEVGPALDELVVVLYSDLWEPVSGTPRSQDRGEQALPLVTKAISYARAHKEKRKADYASSSKE